MSEKKKGGFFKRLFNKITGSEKDDSKDVQEQSSPEITAEETAPIEAAQDHVAKRVTEKGAETVTKPVAESDSKPQIDAVEEVQIKPSAEIEVEAEQPVAEPKRAPTPQPLPKSKPAPTAKPAPQPKPAKQNKPKKAQPQSVQKPKPNVATKPAVSIEQKPEPVTQAIAEPTAKPAPKPEPAVKPEQKPTPKQEAEQAPQPTSQPDPQDKSAPATPQEPEEAKSKSWFGRLKTGLSKSSNALTSGITGIFTKAKLDTDTVQDLEDILIQADLGIDMAVRITDKVSKGRFDKQIDPQEVKQILADEVSAVLKPVEVPFTFDDSQKPFVILVVGVNGAGKTTTIGKLGAIAKDEGYSLTIAACDTFRAAAIEQLKVWGDRIGANVISRPTGADAAGLAFDAHTQAVENNSDILIIDTAGRLQNKSDLMAELEKIVRVLKKKDDGAPHAVLLVLDATTGQNAISQTEVFSKVAGVTGIIMTKLDGTARGGILVAIAEKFKLPIHAIGVGEQLEDFQPFDADAFARAIAGLEDE